MHVWRWRGAWGPVVGTVGGLSPDHTSMHTASLSWLHYPPNRQLYHFFTMCLPIYHPTLALSFYSENYAFRLEGVLTPWPDSLLVLVPPPPPQTHTVSSSFKNPGTESCIFVMEFVAVLSRLVVLLFIRRSPPFSFFMVITATQDGGGSLTAVHYGTRGPRSPRGGAEGGWAHLL